MARRVLEGELIEGEVAGRIRVLVLHNVFTFERSERWVGEGGQLVVVGGGDESSSSWDLWWFCCLSSKNFWLME